MGQENDPETRIKKAAQKGREYHATAGNCAQCTITALQETFNIQNGDVFQSAGPLAGGTGSSHLGQCGALSGAVLVVGQLSGRNRSTFNRTIENRTKSEEDDSELVLSADRDAAYELVERFIIEYGSPLCYEISDQVIGRVDNEQIIRPTSPAKTTLQEKRSVEPHAADGCPSVVANAVEWAAEIIIRENLRKTNPV